MQNLVQLGEQRRKLHVATTRDDDTIVDLCRVVTDEGPASVVLTKDGTLARMSESGDIVWTCNLDDVQAGGDWFDLTNIDPDLVCLSRHGAMVTVSPTTGEAELVGVFDFGLEAAAWSPDGEVLLMVTSAADDDDETQTKSVLMTMNSQFEVLAEITIPSYLSSLSGDGAKVSVAWRPDGTLCAMNAVDADDCVRKVRVYKRETLDLHAIGRAEDASGTIVKNMQDSGLAWANPGCSQLLAAVQRKGKKTQQVIFFESNGLRHREFALREAHSTTVTSLTWNVTSDLLAVALREDGGTDKVQLWHRCNYHWYMKQEIRFSDQAIQSIQFNEERSSDFYVLLRGMEWREYEVRWEPSTTSPFSDQCPAFVIDGCSLNVTPLEKALIPPPMSMNSINMDFPISDICFCRGERYAGCLLLRLSSGDLVFLSKNGGPASYRALQIPWKESTGNDKAGLRSFLVIGEQQDLINIVAIATASFNADCESIVEIEISGIDGAEALAGISNTSILEDRVLRIVNWSDTSKGALIQLVDGSFLEYDQSNIAPSDVEPLLEPCPWFCAIKDSSPYAGEQHDGHSKLVFGLSTRSRLYFHDMMLTDSASSFYLSLSHEFLCYATAGSRCFLRFLPLKEINSFDPLMGLDQNHLLDGYEPRSVERGAQIVAILPSQPMAVLQMPRGNLEGVYPRALILRFVMLRIARGQYSEAFRMMRKHKVNLNLLVDFDPWHFLEDGTASFIEQVPVIDHLNLFLSGLQDSDITQSRFPVPAWLRRENLEARDRSSFEFVTKVNQVCQKARSTMVEMERSGAKQEGHFLLPILSTYAKENPPKLGDALIMIKDRALQQHNSPKSSKPPMFADKAQNAIHYLAFLAEYELLFETALGMYDYEIARAVARNSQMDPKVYLPLLKRLNALPAHYAKYEVDIRLKRFDTALRNLYESNSASETIEGFEPEKGSVMKFGNSFCDCMSLIEAQKLHQLGLKLFQSDTDKTHSIYISLGEHLLVEKKPETALSVFLAAAPPSLDGAMRAARAAGDWKMYFSLSVDSLAYADAATDEQKENTKEKHRQIARDIANEMVAKETEFASLSKQELHFSAARILLDYGDDVYGAVDLLVNAQCWYEGHRVASLHERHDLIKKCLDSATMYAHTAMDEFHEKVSTFESTLSTYTEVLMLRKKNVFEEGPAMNEADETGSLFSAASNMSNMSLQSTTSAGSTGSSVSSIISVKTTTTFTMIGDDEVNRHRSKFNKGKRQKTKKKRGKNRRKPGSQEELNGLVFTLKSCCPKADYAQIIGETIRFLVFVQQLPLATEVYKSYNVMRQVIAGVQARRVESARNETTEAERRSQVGEQMDEDHHILMELPEEKDVDALACVDLETNLQELFSYLSS